MNALGLCKVRWLADRRCSHPLSAGWCLRWALRALRPGRCAGHRRGRAAAGRRRWHRGRSADRWRLGTCGAAIGFGAGAGVGCLRAADGFLYELLTPASATWRNRGSPHPGLMFPDGTHFDFKQDKIFGDERSEAGEARSPRSFLGILRVNHCATCCDRSNLSQAEKTCCFLSWAVRVIHHFLLFL